MRGGARKGALAACLGLAVAGSVLAPAGAGAAVAPRLSVSTIATGLTLTKINDPSGPFQIRVLTIDPAQAITLDVTLASKKMPGRLPTSQMGANHGALAAINGDFNVDPGIPLHDFAANGSLKQTGFQRGGAFSISQDEQHMYIDGAHPVIVGRNLTAGTSFHVDLWNHGAPGTDQIVGFTKAGGSAWPSPSNSCSARLKQAGALHWEQGQRGVFRDYTVLGESCGSSRMAFGKKGAVILSSKLAGAGAAVVQTLTSGTSVRVSWKMVGSGSPWAGAMDVVGGMPVLVDNGAVVAKNNCGTYFCDRNPRTGIGYTADGKILLVTVDGRQPGLSVGMTLVGFANEMLSLGAVYALNLDGGGSTTMWVQGDGVVNSPSDSSGERWVTNAVLVLPGADTAEPVPLHAVLGSDPSSAAALQAAQLEDTDPASSGGLLDALSGGAFGYSGPLPSQLQPIADAYASRHPPG